MHFTTESKTAQGESGPQSVKYNWSSVKFRDNLELVYQFSLIAIKQRPTPKICIIILNYYILDFIEYVKSGFCYATFTINRTKITFSESSFP